MRTKQRKKQRPVGRPSNAEILQYLRTYVGSARADAGRIAYQRDLGFLWDACDTALEMKGAMEFLLSFHFRLRLVPSALDAMKPNEELLQRMSYFCDLMEGCRGPPSEDIDAVLDDMAGQVGASKIEKRRPDYHRDFWFLRQVCVSPAEIKAVMEFLLAYHFNIKLEGSGPNTDLRFNDRLMKRIYYLCDRRDLRTSSVPTQSEAG